MPRLSACKDQQRLKKMLRFWQHDSMLHLTSTLAFLPLLCCWGVPYLTACPRAIATLFLICPPCAEVPALTLQRAIQTAAGL